MTEPPPKKFRRNSQECNTPSKSSEVSEPLDLFRGQTVLIVDKGIGATQCKILKKHVQSKGGKLIEKLIEYTSNRPEKNQEASSVDFPYFPATKGTISLGPSKPVESKPTSNTNQKRTSNPNYSNDERSKKKVTVVSTSYVYAVQWLKKTDPYLFSSSSNNKNQKTNLHQTRNEDELPAHLVEVVRVSWITESLQSGKLKEVEHYRISAPLVTQDQRTSTNTNPQPPKTTKDSPLKRSYSSPLIIPTSSASQASVVDASASPKESRSSGPWGLSSSSDEEHGGKDDQDKASASPSKPGVPNCYHEKPAILKRVTKAGPNEGKMFYCCQQVWPKKRCRYFQWYPDNSHDTATNTTDNNNSHENNSHNLNTDETRHNITGYLCANPSTMVSSSSMVNKSFSIATEEQRIIPYISNPTSSTVILSSLKERSWLYLSSSSEDEEKEKESNANTKHGVHKLDQAPNPWINTREDQNNNSRENSQNQEDQEEDFSFATLLSQQIYEYAWKTGGDSKSKSNNNSNISKATAEKRKFLSPIMGPLVGAISTSSSSSSASCSIPPSVTISPAITPAISPTISPDLITTPPPTLTPLQKDSKQVNQRATKNEDDGYSLTFSLPHRHYYDHNSSQSSETPPSPPLDEKLDDNAGADGGNDKRLEEALAKVGKGKEYKSKYIKEWRKGWACQKAPEELKFEQQKCPNKEIIDILQVLQNKSKSTGDKWREYAYRKAITALKNYPKKLESYEEAKSIRGIGGKIALKIQEILKTGQLRQAQSSDEISQAMELFSKVWGAGPQTVQKWIAQGFRTLEEVRQNPQRAHLTPNLEIGLKYYYDFLQRIPRKEVEKIEAVVVEHMKAIDKNLKALTCGSFRRGKPDCGDIDILITHKKGYPVDQVLPILIPALQEVGFLTDHLTHSWSKPGTDSDKYMGVCQLPADQDALHRRIDLRVYPLEEWPLAILYFTGSDHFNRSMRLWAKKNGFHLSDHELTRRYAEDMESEPIPVRTELDIFKALGLEYKAPHEREV